jgi:hypothetical protein
LFANGAQYRHSFENIPAKDYIAAPKFVDSLYHAVVTLDRFVAKTDRTAPRPRLDAAGD